MTRVADSLTLLSSWLAATSNADVATGLSKSQARIRAEQLRKELLGFGPKKVTTHNLDEESKDAIYALVDLIEVEASSRGPDSFAQANVVYQYLADSSWVLDDFGERRDLMRTCARLGWGALGLDIEKVEAIRTNPGPDQNVSFELCLPDAVGRDFSGISAAAERGRQLAKLVNAKPGVLAARLGSLYEEHSRQIFGRRVLDVTEYLSGAIALQAGSAFRMAGALDTAETWLSRAGEHFAKTTDPKPLIVRTLCERLAVMFDRRQLREVCENAPGLVSETRRLGMHRDLMRCRVIYGAALKTRGFCTDAIDELRALKAELDPETEPTILITTLANLADALTCEGRFREAASLIEEGYRVKVGLCLGKPHLDSVAGQLLRRQGRLPEAIEAFRLSVLQYREMGAQECEAEARVSLAESLVAANRYREAEIEIRSAMPVLEGSGLVAETLAAAAILRDSIRRRKLDPEASNLRD